MQSPFPKKELLFFFPSIRMERHPDTPSAPARGNGTPDEPFLRRLAFEMRSCNFGTGGRIITPPTPEELQAVTAAELAAARRYYANHLQEVVHCS